MTVNACSVLVIYVQPVYIYIVGFLSGGNNFSVQLVEYIIELSFKLVMISSLDGPSSPRRSMLMTYLAALL